MYKVFVCTSGMHHVGIPLMYMYVPRSMCMCMWVQRRRIESQIFINVSCRHTHVGTRVHAYSEIELKSNFNLVDFMITLSNLYWYVYPCTLTLDTHMIGIYGDTSLRLAHWSHSSQASVVGGGGSYIVMYIIPDRVHLHTVVERDKEIR